MCTAVRAVLHAVWNTDVGSVTSWCHDLFPVHTYLAASTERAVTYILGTHLSTKPSNRQPPQDVSDGRRRVVAAKTLGFIVASCGNVMGPYLEYPQLLSVLLRMLHEGHSVQRREVIKVGGRRAPPGPLRQRVSYPRLRLAPQAGVSGVTAERQSSRKG